MQTQELKGVLTSKPEKTAFSKCKRAKKIYSASDPVIIHSTRQELYLYFLQGWRNEA